MCVGRPFFVFKRSSLGQLADQRLAGLQAGDPVLATDT